MGRLSRTKGRAFEQEVARLYRATFPSATVRRSLQAHKPYEPDLVIEGAPSNVLSLWNELTTGRQISVQGKLEQACRDIEEARKSGRWDREQWRPHRPVVIYRPFRSRTIKASTYLSVVVELCGLSFSGEAVDDIGPVAENMIIDMDFEEFLILLTPGRGAAQDAA